VDEGAWVDLWGVVSITMQREGRAGRSVTFCARLPTLLIPAESYVSPVFEVVGESPVSSSITYILCKGQQSRRGKPTKSMPNDQRKRTSRRCGDSHAGRHEQGDNRKRNHIVLSSLSSSELCRSERRKEEEEVKLPNSTRNQVEPPTPS